jgi:dihydroxy-acid dehydratase
MRARHGRTGHAGDAHPDLGHRRDGAGRHTCALITDGRFSGGTKGASIGHVSPEATQGGLIAVVEEGDTIRIDIPGKSIELAVDKQETDRRFAQWKKPEPKIKTGYMARYARMVSSAGNGAVFQNN